LGIFEDCGWLLEDGGWVVGGEGGEGETVLGVLKGVFDPGCGLGEGDGCAAFYKDISKQWLN
jgi:hypothetical protein